MHIAAWIELIVIDELVKRSFEVLDGQAKKLDIQGVVFLSGPQLYMRYAEGLIKTYNEGDRTLSYDAISN